MGACGWMRRHARIRVRDRGGVCVSVWMLAYGCGDSMGGRCRAAAPPHLSPPCLAHHPRVCCCLSAQPLDPHPHPATYQGYPGTPRHNPVTHSATSMDRTPNTKPTHRGIPGHTTRPKRTYQACHTSRPSGDRSGCVGSARRPRGRLRGVACRMSSPLRRRLRHRRLLGRSGDRNRPPPHSQETGAPRWLCPPALRS